MRREKVEVITKALLLKFLREHIDALLKIKDGIINIANDNGLDANYCLEWTLDQASFKESDGTEQEDEEELEEGAEQEEGGAV